VAPDVSDVSEVSPLAGTNGEEYEVFDVILECSPEEDGRLTMDH
jgi:hypothetical protein